MLTVGTFWGGSAAEALHRELLTIGESVGASIEVRTFSFYGLLDYLSKVQAPGGEEQLDLVVVPNDWLGQLSERSIIGELPSAKVEDMQARVVRQAMLAVSDRDRVLAFPVSAELLALVYDPERFPAGPRSMDEILSMPMPAGTLPIAISVASPYHLAPFVSSYHGSLVDLDGGFVWPEDTVRRVVMRFAPWWAEAHAWRAFSGEDLESYQLQLFAEGRLASFLAGPWLLEALEECGHPFAVVPIPAFADAPQPARALVGYQCVAVARDSSWLDLSLEVGSRLLRADVNERLTRATRRLPVLMESYRTQKAMASKGTVGFLRALEQGQSFPTGTHWTDGYRAAQDRLQRLTRRTRPPTPDDVRRAVQGGPA